MSDWDEAVVSAEIERQQEEESLGKAGFVQVDAGVWVAAQHIQKIVLKKSVQLTSGETVPLGNNHASLASDIESAIWHLQGRWT